MQESEFPTKNNHACTVSIDHVQPSVTGFMHTGAQCMIIIIYVLAVYSFTLYNYGKV